MNFGEILYSLANRGFSIEVHGERLLIDPMPDAQSLAVLRTQRTELRYFIADRGGRWPLPPASGHTYVGLNVVGDEASLNRFCIACSVRWDEHGRPPKEEWDLVDGPDDALKLRVCPATTILTARIAKIIVVGHACWVHQ